MADVTLPQLGETVTEGTITQWFKQVGDTVAEDEPLFEVSTDKVDTEVPSPVAGTLTEIRVQEGETVEVGAVIAVVGDADDAPPAADGDQGADTGAADTDAAATETAETGSADAEAPAEAEAPSGDASGDGAQAEPAAASQQSEAQGEPQAAAEPEPAPTSDSESAADEEPAAAEPAASGGGADNRLLSPVVRRLVNENNLDASEITGTGPGGRITREDVLDHLDKRGKQAQPAAPAAEQPAAAPAARAPQPSAAPTAPPSVGAPVESRPAVTPGERDTTVPLSKIRKMTGSHMVMSKSVSPHAFSVVEVDYANVDATRTAIKDEWKASEGFSLTYLPFIARAIIDAIAEFAHMNASVGENDLIVHNYVDLAIAVDLDYAGLIAPVIRDADTKRLRAIAREISDKAARAKAKKLGPDEISGGTFTISNNGSAGSVLTMPIINQPQVAIISTDAIVPKPVVVSAGGTDAIAVHPVGNLAMSWDHRAFDGAYAANFLKRIKEILETKDWNGEV